MSSWVGFVLMMGSGCGWSLGEGANFFIIILAKELFFWCYHAGRGSSLVEIFVTLV